MKTIKAGDYVIILRGTWKGCIMKVTHVSENGRWVFTNFSEKQRFRRRNVEKSQTP